MDSHLDTPVLFLVFNRPDLTREVFSQIRKVKPRRLFVAADGPRSGNEEDEKKCAETRGIIDQVDWYCDLKTLFRERNLGTRVAVSSAITWFFENVDRGIILEDDCYPHESFFHYCEALLNIYENDDRIFHINGNDFSGITVDHPQSYYFTRFQSVWGWATWRRAWQNFDLGMPDYFLQRERILKKGSYISNEAARHYRKSFDELKVHEHKCWDAQWIYAVIRSNGLSLTPEVNLVKNIGTTNGSTHRFLKDSFRDGIQAGTIYFPLKHPEFKINDNIDKLNFDNYRGKSLRRIYRIVRENGLFTVILYYIKVHLSNKLKK